jgi:hypothetical protein
MLPEEHDFAFAVPPGLDHAEIDLQATPITPTGTASRTCGRKLGTLKQLMCWRKLLSCHLAVRDTLLPVFLLSYRMV